MENAVFIDRDGVLTQLIFNSDTGEYESPYNLEQLKFEPDIITPLLNLQKEFRLFMITNQPGYVKNKTSMENLIAIKKHITEYFEKNKIFFTEYYYCFHYPQGDKQGYSIECNCRKPKTGFINAAANSYRLNLTGSWIIGDTDTDILCGKNSNLKTALILNPLSNNKRTGLVMPDIFAESFKQAVDKIIIEGRAI